MSTYEPNDLYEIGSLLDKISKQRINTPHDMYNKVRSYITEQQEQSKQDDVVQEALDPVGKVDLSTAKFKLGDVFTADQISDDFDAVIVGIEENEEGDGVAYNLQALGEIGITLDETQIEGEPSHSLF